MASRKWYGAVTAFTIDPDLGQSDNLYTVSLNSPAYHNGDSILRCLCSWSMETALIDNDSSVQLPHVPYKFGFNFQPPPFGEAQFDPGGAGGDSLCKDFTRWHRTPWTDGTLYATKFQADSGGIISVQGQRTIHDKTSDVINLWAKVDSTAQDSGQYLDFKVWGWMWIEFLILSPFG